MRLYKLQKFPEERKDGKDTFYKLPKNLIENPYYDELKPRDILVYNLLYDRIRLSRQTTGDYTDRNYSNGKGELFCYYTKQGIADKLGKHSSRSTVYKSFNKLEELNLIKQVESKKSLEMNNPNKIFVARAASVEDIVSGKEGLIYRGSVISGLPPCQSDTTPVLDLDTSKNELVRKNNKNINAKSDDVDSFDNKDQANKVNEVWSYYLDKVKGYYQPREFSDRRKKMLASRLKTYSVDELKQVVDTAMTNKFRVEGTFNNKPDQLFRNDDKVDDFLNDAKNSGSVEYDDVDYYADLRDDK
jgi:hypothetical protein